MPATATAIIDRQDRRNALDLETCGRLTDEIAAAVDAGARAVVVTGAGTHFCAGADLALVHGDALSAALRRLLDTIASVPPW